MIEKENVEVVETEVKEKDAGEGAIECTLEDLIFPVDLIENPTKTNREYSRIVKGIVDGEVMHLNYCSPRYELVKNETIFPEVEKILNEKNITFDVVYKHTQHARFYGEYTITDERFAYEMEGTNDKIRFRWDFQHSYNGLTKYKGIAGFFRLVCENGLVIPVEEMNDYNLVLQGKHTSSILKSLDKFTEILDEVTTNLGDVKESITAKYEKLALNVPTNPEERVVEVLKANKIGVVDNVRGNTMNEIMNRIDVELNGYNMGYTVINDWLIYNAINAYIHNDSFNIAAPEKRRDTDLKVLEYMLKYQ